MAVKVRPALSVRMEDNGRARKDRAGKGRYLFPPEGEEFTVDFDWDVRGNNAFDRKSVEILSGGEVTVTAARLVNGCDIKLELSNGLRFESFADSSIEEYWRLVVRDEEDSVQLVAEPTGISEV